ncbi:MAG TPA: PhnD/SsuA/transferrin family substrate-binding protein [Candidatus Limnocylindria bacterium]|nr:PhnD/SsuA/transferrin family substrate-binding protein [Candidatus Limnocylindria bacterium]
MPSRAGSAQPLRVASHLAPEVESLYAYLASRMAERIGRRPEFTVAESYERCAKDVDDVCFVCSIPYLLFADAGRIDMEVVAAPVLRGDRYGGRPIYFSDVIVASSSPHRSFADLRGASWAYNEPFSHSGYVTVLHHLATLGEDGTYFSRMVEAGFHQTAIRMVADGRVDAAAIDSQVLDIELRDHPELAVALRRIGTIGPSTIQPVVVSRSRLTDGERAAITQTLLDVADEPAAQPFLDAALVERFVPVSDGSYADIRVMFERVQAAGLLEAAWHATWRAMADADGSAPSFADAAPA